MGLFKKLFFYFAVKLPSDLKKSKFISVAETTLSNLEIRYILTPTTKLYSDIEESKELIKLMKKCDAIVLCSIFEDLAEQDREITYADCLRIKSQIELYC